MPPAGYKRSRALWDESRRLGASWKDTMRAVLYELQPIRFQRARRYHMQWMSTGSWAIAAAVDAVRDVCRAVPTMAKGILQFLWQWKARHWMAVVFLVGYCYFVRLMHELLLAGPLIITVTCLALIFTIGLGDNQDRDGLSAYTVFNRGFERLLGSVDVEALVAQQIGGGLAAGGGGRGPFPPGHEEEGDRHRAQQQQRRRQQQQQQPPENNNDDNRAGPANDNNNNNNNNRARKSGKKARRRDLAQRREINDQRQGAAALGFEQIAEEEM